MPLTNNFRTVENLLDRIDETKQDLNDFLVECISTFHARWKKTQIKEMAPELDTEIL
jgi:hypothetical protein